MNRAERRQRHRLRRVPTAKAFAGMNINLEAPQGQTGWICSCGSRGITSIEGWSEFVEKHKHPAEES